MNGVEVGGGSSGGRSPSLKPEKVTLFTMILYNSESNIRDNSHVVVHCRLSQQCCENMLQPSSSSEAVMRLQWRTQKIFMGGGSFSGIG